MAGDGVPGEENFEETWTLTEREGERGGSRSKGEKKKWVFKSLLASKGKRILPPLRHELCTKVVVRRHI